MIQKDFRKLNRKELLEILLAQAEEIERLQEQCNALQQQLDTRKIAIEQAGSIADASMQLNAVFEAAQAAADEYLINVRRQGETERTLIDKAQQLLIETERHCAALEQQTIAKCDALLQAALQKGRSDQTPAFRPDHYIW